MKKKNDSLSDKIIDFSIGSLEYAREKTSMAVSEIMEKGEKNRGKAGIKIKREAEDAVGRGLDFSRKVAGRFFRGIGLATAEDLEDIRKKIHNE